MRRWHQRAVGVPGSSSSSPSSGSALAWTMRIWGTGGARSAPKRGSRVGLPGRESVPRRPSRVRDRRVELGPWTGGVGVGGVELPLN